MPNAHLVIVVVKDQHWHLGVAMSRSTLNVDDIPDSASHHGTVHRLGSPLSPNQCVHHSPAPTQRLTSMILCLLLHSLSKHVLVWEGGAYGRILGIPVEKWGRGAQACVRMSGWTAELLYHGVGSIPCWGKEAKEGGRWRERRRKEGQKMVDRRIKGEVDQSCFCGWYLSPATARCVHICLPTLCLCWPTLASRKTRHWLNFGRCRLNGEQAAWSFKIHLSTCWGWQYQHVLPNILLLARQEPRNLVSLLRFCCSIRVLVVQIPIPRLTHHTLDLKRASSTFRFRVQASSLSWPFIGPSSHQIWCSTYPGVSKVTVIPTRRILMNRQFWEIYCMYYYEILERCLCRYLVLIMNVWSCEAHWIESNRYIYRKIGSLTFR